MTTTGQQTTGHPHTMVHGVMIQLSTTIEHSMPEMVPVIDVVRIWVCIRDVSERLSRFYTLFGYYPFNII